MEMSPTVTHRLLTTLQKHGYVVQDENTQQYELGMKFLEFASLLQDKLDFKDMLAPFMKALATSTGETIFLTWLEGNRGLSIAIAESNQSIKFQVKVGSKKSLHAAASNLIILAYLPEDLQDQILTGKLEKFTEKTITDPVQLKEKIKKIKELGYSCTLGETTPDAIGIGVPLFDSTGRIIASLNVAGPAYRLPEKEINRIIDLLRKKQQNVQGLINKLGLTHAQIQSSL